MVVVTEEEEGEYRELYHLLFKFLLLVAMVDIGSIIFVCII